MAAAVPGKACFLVMFKVAWYPGEVKRPAEEGRAWAGLGAAPSGRVPGKPGSELGPPPSPQAEGNKRRFEHSVWKWRQRMEAWYSTRVTSLTDGIRQPVIPEWLLRQEAGRGSSVHCSPLVASRRG